MFPKPHMSDVFMDLMADSTEFLTGKAHRGMALGSNNIYERCQEVLLKGSIHIHNLLYLHSHIGVAFHEGMVNTFYILQPSQISQIMAY